MSVAPGENRPRPKAVASGASTAMAMKGADKRPRQTLPLSRIGRRSVALGGRGVNAWVDFPSGDRWPSPVEGAALEMPYSRKAVLGSNPSLSATPKPDCAARARAQTIGRGPQQPRPLVVCGCGAGVRHYSERLHVHAAAAPL